MENMQKKTKTKTTGEAEKGGKAARVKRMRRGNKKTAEVREENSERLFGERSVK
jgi:hypothetical protein